MANKKIFGVAYVGNTTVKNLQTHKDKESYKCWYHMIRRCYENKDTSYKDCSVCEEWLCYANFEKWYEDNYWECGSETMHLDKDILKHGNRIYSPNNCIFVPKDINMLFVKQKNKRINNLPIGVKLDSSTLTRDKQLYVARISKKNKTVTICRTIDPITAFNSYKVEKENYIKEVADEYKSKYPNFPIKLYEAMYKWEVSIND